jgi:POT family proton-dependent oligopeptide transporter
MDNELEKGGITPGASPPTKSAVTDEPLVKVEAKPGVAAPDVSLATSDRHPTGLWFFFWGEFAERSSYYGMRAILPLYLTAILHFADTTAGPIYYSFKMACYFLPLVGGIIADRWLGRYWTIVGFSVPYVLGHFILGIESQVALVIALGLLAGGSGVIKPNISTLMGQTYDQQRPGNERLRSAAFLWFYLSINIGALISMFAMPLLRDRFGYAIAFQFPAWLMVASLAVFASGKRYYAVETKQRHEQTPEERRLQWKTLGQLFGIFALVVLFWVGYEQNDTIWVFFTRDYVDLRVPFTSYPIKADQLQFLNSLFVIILIPTFNVLYASLDPKAKIFTPMRKVLAGFLFTAASIAIMAVAGFLAQGHTVPAPAGSDALEVSTVKLSVLWPAMAYIVLTVGEVLLYGTMLELAYAAAPKSMKGFITACFLLTNTAGNAIAGVLSTQYGGSLVDPVADRGPLMPGQFFAYTTGVVVAAAVGFFFIGKRFERAQTAQAAGDAAKKALAESDMSPAPRGPAGDGITDRDRIQ